MTRLNNLDIARNMIGGVIMLSAILFCGCSKRPKGVLSEKKMVSLMADMQLAESYSNTVGLSRQGNDERGALGKGVLSAHGVTQEQLDTTLAWYGRNIDEYSELYEKVDKEIVSRRKKLMKEKDKKEDFNSADMLWPYQTHGVLSSLGNSDAWILSIESPELNKGDVLEWTMRFSESAALNGVLGVEYDDGTSDAMSQMLTGKQKYELRLQTDRAKLVSRIYGTLRLKDVSYKPVYADSIMLHRLPFDSLEFNKYRSLRHYGAPTRIKPKVERKDTVQPDSLNSLNSDAVSKKRVDNPNLPKPAENTGLITINPVSGKKSTTKEKTDKPIKQKLEKPTKIVK